MPPATPADLLSFWRAAGPAKWFAKSDTFDAEIRARFEPLHHAAARGEHDGDAATAEGALGLILALDQVPRNIYRGSGHAFATDGKARLLARAAVYAGHHLAVEPALRPFFMLPFEHSEDAADQARSVALCEAHQHLTGDAETLKWARVHADIITRFGRFPHRNAILGRESTPEETAFLLTPGSSF